MGRIAENGWEFYNRIWRPAELVVSDMERAGFTIDVLRCERGADETRALITPLEKDLNQWAGRPINWGSWQQKSKLLYQDKGFDKPPVKGSMSAVGIADVDDSGTSAAAIEYLADHVPDPDDRKALRLLRKLSIEIKNLQFWVALPTFVDSRGRIHCSLCATTETGRLASSNPNLQNIPTRTETGRLLREAFIAAYGKRLVVLDMPGLEWRILAHCLVKMYGDTSLVDEVLAGICPHSATAVRMGLCPPPIELVKKLYPAERGYGKTLNYGINYGKTGAGLGVAIRDADGEPIGTARGQELLDQFFVARPGVKRFQDDMIQYAKRNGKVVSLLGRPRYIDLPLTRYDKRQRKEVPASGGRQALNVIQNNAADIMTLAMLRAHPKLHPELAHWNSETRRALAAMGAEQLLQVHDELIFEVDDGKGDELGQLVAPVMENALEGVRDFLCPLGPVDYAVGDNWGCKA